MTGIQVPPSKESDTSKEVTFWLIEDSLNLKIIIHISPWDLNCLYFLFVLRMNSVTFKHPGKMIKFNINSHIYTVTSEMKIVRGLFVINGVRAGSK